MFALHGSLEYTFIYSNTPTCCELALFPVSAARTHRPSFCSRACSSGLEVKGGENQCPGVSLPGASEEVSGGFKLRWRTCLQNGGCMDIDKPLTIPMIY